MGGQRQPGVVPPDGGHRFRRPEPWVARYRAESREWPPVTGRYEWAQHETPPEAAWDQEFTTTFRFDVLEGTYERKDHDPPLGLGADGAARLFDSGGRLGSVWPLRWPGAGSARPVLDYFPLGEEWGRPWDVDDLHPEVGDLAPFGFLVGGGWTDEDDVDPQSVGDIPCPRDPAGMWGFYPLPGDADDDCPPGAIHALQPNEGPDFVRFAFHATDGRRLDLVDGDGLDDVLHDPAQGLRLWTGDRDIAPGELMVGRRPTGETYPGISLGGRLGYTLHDGAVSRFDVEPDDDYEVWTGPFPFDPIGMEQARGCLNLWTMVTLGVAAAAVALVVGLFLALGDSDDGGDAREPATESAEQSEDPDAAAQPEPGDAPPGETVSVDDPEDLARVADGSSAVGEDPLAEITGLQVIGNGPYWVCIDVLGDTVDIDEARQDHYSSAYQVLVESRDGKVYRYGWELHDGALLEGVNLDDPSAPAADVTFSARVIMFELPDVVGDIRGVGVQTFSNPNRDEGEPGGPEFFDEARLDMDASF